MLRYFNHWETLQGYYEEDLQSLQTLGSCLISSFEIDNPSVGFVYWALLDQ